MIESRRPERQAWLECDRERSLRRAVVPGAGAVETWVEVTDVRGDLVSFRWTFVFEDGTPPDRPGAEPVVIARRPG